MARFHNKENYNNLNDRFMEKIFSFPRLYRLKMWTVKNAFKLIEPVIMKNYFTFEEVLADIITDGTKVFEIGCGDGTLYQRLEASDKNLEYTGTDINKEMVEFCRTKFPMATWQHYDSLPYPYADEYFDFCIIENVLHHLNDYDSICRLIKEAMRIAKRVVFLETLQSDNKFLQFWKSIYWRITDGGKFYFTCDEFHSLFKDTGAELKWEKSTEPLHQIYSCEISRSASLSKR